MSKMSRHMSMKPHYEPWPDAGERVVTHPSLLEASIYRGFLFGYVLVGDI